MQGFIGGLELSSSKESPLAGVRITLKLRNYSTDIEGALVSWSVDGKLAKKAYGATTFDVTVPTTGKKISITVSVITPTGQVLNASKEISAGDVDLVVESDGYVPNFYPGKISPSYQNTVRVTAIPHLISESGVPYDPKTLIYKWQKNGKVLDSQSGYGKQSIAVAGEIVPRPFTLTVEVTPRNGGTKVSNDVFVEPQKPFLGFYSVDPLYGTLLNEQIGSVLRIGGEREASVVAIPFGFNIGKDGDDLTKLWFINGVERSELSENDSVILRAPEDAEGESRIELKVRNMNNILQQAEYNFRTLFTNSN